MCIYNYTYSIIYHICIYTFIPLHTYTLCSGWRLKIQRANSECCCPCAQFVSCGRNRDRNPCWQHPFSFHELERRPAKKYKTVCAKPNSRLHTELSYRICTYMYPRGDWLAFTLGHGWVVHFLPFPTWVGLFDPQDPKTDRLAESGSNCVMPHVSVAATIIGTVEGEINMFHPKNWWENVMVTMVKFA